MNESTDLSGTRLTDDEKAAVSEFCGSLADLLDTNLVSITLYGSAMRDDYQPSRSDINLLVILKQIDVPTLKMSLDVVAKGRRHGIAPFFITDQDIHSSADVFPVKFLTMQESYKVLVGSDILGELEIRHEHLRLRCEQEIKNLLLRLRRHYLVGSGRGLDQMMSRSIGPLTETLRAVFSLKKGSMPSRKEVPDAVAARFNVDASVLQQVIALRHAEVSPRRDEGEQLYDQFMALVDTIAQAVDQME